MITHGKPVKSTSDKIMQMAYPVCAHITTAGDRHMPGIAMSSNFTPQAGIQLTVTMATVKAESINTTDQRADFVQPDDSRNNVVANAFLLRHLPKFRGLATALGTVELYMGAVKSVALTWQRRDNKLLCTGSASHVWCR